MKKQSMKKQRLVTKWLAPRRMIDTGYGYITCLEWCEKECKRLNAKGECVTLAYNAQRHVAVVR